MNRYRIGAVVAVGLLALASSASAQTGPSSTDIVNALKPATLDGSSMRGIRPIAPGAATDATAKATGPSASSRAATSAAPSVNLYVPFATDSAALSPAAVAALDELGKALTSPTLAGDKFRIEGHTDTVGTKPYNKSLSERRAEAVSTYLEQKYGVGQARLEIVGVGSDHLLVPTPEQTPEPRNRRVTVVNLGA